MNELKSKALDTIEALRGEYEEVCQYIFDHPELGFNEYLSSKRLQEYLAAHGFAVEAGVAGMPTAFRAVRSNGEGPTVALVCEYDALPEVGHACGHNVIGTASATAAIAAATALDTLPGRIVVLGSPAEETRGAGKQLLLDAGLLDDVDCALMFHPGPATILSEPTYAVSARRYRFHGKTGSPVFSQDTANALNAAVLFINNINALRHYVKRGTYYNAIIVNGGSSSTYIPDFTEVELNMRSLTRPELDDLVERIGSCAEAAAMATGCTTEGNEIGRTYDDIWPSHVLVDALERNMTEIGLPVHVKITDTPYAATDMGNISQRVPAVHSIYKLGIQTGHHSKDFAAAVNGSNGYRLTREISMALATTVIDLLENPEQLAAAKEELSCRTGY